MKGGLHEKLRVLSRPILDLAFYASESKLIYDEPECGDAMEGLQFYF
jgi:hypothetical protein